GVWSLDRPALPGPRRYHLHLSYLARGAARCAVFLKPRDGTAREVDLLPATNGAWRQARVYFELTRTQPFRLDFHNPSQGEQNTLSFRDVCITDAGALDQDYLVARQDWHRLSPFLLLFKGTKQVERRGQLPLDWSAQTQDAGSKGEAALDRIDGRPVLA